MAAPKRRKRISYERHISHDRERTRSIRRGGDPMVVTLYILWLVLNVVGLILMVQGLLKWNKWLGFVE